MNCFDYAAWIAQKLDGSLSGDRLKKLEEHMAKCGRCRAELILQQRIHDSLKQEMPSGLSADFTQRVSKQALAIAGRQRRVLRLPDLVPVFALAAGAILLVVYSADLARVLPPLMQSFAGAVETSAISLREAILALVARLPELPSGQITSMGRFFTPMMTLLTASAAACIAVFWSFSRVRAFLRS
jgi:anti-sigma factor RsiW